MKILFIVQAHQLLEQSMVLSEALITAGHPVLYSADMDESEIAVLRARFAGHLNFHLVRSGHLTWCGYSQIRAYFNALQLALNESISFDFAVNISETCLLFRPISALEQFLAEKASLGVDGFAWSFMSSWSREVLETQRGLYEIDWTTFDRFDGRNVVFKVPSRTAPYWSDVRASPVTNSAQRFSYSCLDDDANRTLFIRPIDLFEKAVRLRYYERHGLAIGRCWFVFSKALVERLLIDAVRTETWSIFQSAFEPDEYLVHNVLRNEFPRTNIQNTNLHIGNGNTGPITIEDLRNEEQLAESVGRYFHRKLYLSSEDLQWFAQHVW